MPNDPVGQGQPAQASDNHASSREGIGHQYLDGSTAHEKEEHGVELRQQMSYFSDISCSWSRNTRACACLGMQRPWRSGQQLDHLETS